jgi:uncharacterized protein YyaL (SSP411 family)
MDRVWADYWDGDNGGLFDTARGRGTEPGLLPARAKPIQDTPTPSPNGVAGMVCARLHEITTAPRWRERGEALVRAFAGGAAELGLYAAAYLLAVDWQLHPITHLVIVGDGDDPIVGPMHREALAGFLPRRIVQWIAPADGADRALPAALAGMVSTAKAPRAYCCTGMACSPPAEDLDSWRAVLRAPSDGAGLSSRGY